ncbi:MAG TPA: tetratricopeptide repeat protein [Terriglobales bacterium]|nr:tetratricopeptide repeat protein [Terriglobales bacterium]
MKRLNDTAPYAVAAILLLSSITWTACSRTSNASEPNAGAANGKLPITTKSEEARKEFLAGRDLSERLLAQDSLQHFDKAIALDPEFASAELARANSAPTAKEFFEHQKKAVELADKTSPGEKLFILANEAGANGKPAEQKQYLDKLAADFPGDERVQFALGGYYFGQQEYDPAIAHYKKATEISPSYSPAYNLLGYSYRQRENYAEAERAFKKYIELIPNDPNPYDSYAELLMKMGRFDDSITQYRKALSIDPHFNNSHFGIAADLMYSGKADAARSELQTMADQARNDGERRTAMFGMAVLAADNGKLGQALEAVDKQYAIAEKKNDAAAMSADLQAKGNILEQMHRYNDAAQQFDRSAQVVSASGLSQQIKDNTALQHLFNVTALAIEKGEAGAAKQSADEFRQKAEAANNSAQLKQAHELAGRIALAGKDYNNAVSELEQSNLQNPRNLYRLGLAYRAKGDSGKAREYFKKAADFNSLPNLNYAFIRTEVQKIAGKKG